MSKDFFLLPLNQTTVPSEPEVIESSQSKLSIKSIYRIIDRSAEVN